MFVELAASSNFSFLRGASHPEEIAAAVAASGASGFGLCDRNTLAGVVRGHMAARQMGLDFAPGCRLVFADATPDVLAWPMDRRAYGRLCRLLTIGNMRGEKGDCSLFLDDLVAWGEGLALAPVAETGTHDALDAALATLAPVAGSLRLAVNRPYGPADARLLATWSGLARRHGVAPLATNLPLYHTPARRPLQDVVTAIRAHTTVDQAGRRLAANAERHIKTSMEMARLFAELPEAVGETRRLMESLAFSLEELRYEYPEEPTDPGRTPQQTLERLVAHEAKARYRAGVPPNIAKGLQHELSIVEGLGYAPYFLTVYDIVRFAHSRGILVQGRGSAANSAICYCLGITEVDPSSSELLFERFISPERPEPPDIDVDFEHERREEVIQYIYEKYGRERAGIAATVITYRSRSAVREVGKALGFSEDAVAGLAGAIWGRSDGGIADEDVRRRGLDPTDRRVDHLMRLSDEIIGFPRHLSQHVGGFVITRGRLDELVPIRKAAMDGRTNVEWDKDDLDALGILKIDVLALGMLTCLRKGLALLAAHYAADFPAPPACSAPPGETAGVPEHADWPVTIATIPKEEAEVYKMICRADTLGVFQIESRAQMTMLPRLKPSTFYDLVIEVAIVRPGPIQGDMVHPYLRRRQKKEQVNYPTPELKDVLQRTLGIPLFQEQAMRIAIVAAGFTPSEADQLRRAMATFKKVGTIGTFQQKMIDGMTARGYTRDFAERCFKQIEGFGEYGFPESHAASFAILVYASSWLKCHYPDVFCAALLNSQPMGFYAPAQIIRDAQRHGVEVRPVDVNHSEWDCTLEEGPPAAERLHPDHAEMRGAIRSRHAVRLGLRFVKGLGEGAVRRLVAERGAGYDSVRDLWLRSGLSRSAVERLADADTFASIGLRRRDGLWAAAALDAAGRAEDLPLFAAANYVTLQEETAADLPPMPPGEEVIHDYRFLSFSLKAHPVGFVRHHLARERVVRAEELRHRGNGVRVAVAGLVLVRQRPGSAKGVIFMTVEDETGIANVIVWPRAFERFRHVILGARFVSVTGRLQSEQGVIHVVAEKVEDRTHLLDGLSEEVVTWDALDRADEVKRPGHDGRTSERAGARLSRLLKAAPELSGDLAAAVAQNATLKAALEAHRHAAALIATGRGEDDDPPGSSPMLQERSRPTTSDRPPPGARRGAGRTHRALPKGRNFH